MAWLMKAFHHGTSNRYRILEEEETRGDNSAGLSVQQRGGPSRE